MSEFSTDRFYCHTDYKHLVFDVTYLQSGNWYKGIIKDTYATTNGIKWKLIYVLFENVLPLVHNQPGEVKPQIEATSIIMKIYEENINAEFIDIKEYLWTEQEWRERQIKSIIE